MSSILQRRQFTLVAIFFQMVFIALFWVFVRYKDHALPKATGSKVYVNTDYPLFQDIHVMIFVGFGFLMAFLKRYGFSAVSVNLLLSAFVCQWAMLLRGFLTKDFHDTGRFTVSINELMKADMSCVVVLITMGVLLGKLTPVQFLLLAFFETSISVMVEHILFSMLHINDGGRALVVHTFGAYFGLAASLVGHKRNVMMDEEGSIQHSDLFSMIGTLFLWIFFPSFNAAAQWPEHARHRAIMNTYLSMSSCTIATFLFSSLADPMGRFNMIHIQSSTLAGGVAMGTVANVILTPSHAVIVGSVAGLVSVIGHAWITPKILEKRFKIYDTCGVHNLHGLPGLLSGVFSIIFVLLYAPEDYHDSLYNIYPYWKGGPFDGDRDAQLQALYQLAGIGLTVLSAILGGIFTGLILRFPLWNQVTDTAQVSFGDNTDYYYGSPEFDFLKKFASTNLQMLERHPLQQEVY